MARVDAPPEDIALAAEEEIYEGYENTDVHAVPVDGDGGGEEGEGGREEEHDEEQAWRGREGTRISSLAVVPFL